MRGPEQRYRRVLGYCRVSSDEQAESGTSLTGQQEQLERWCKSHSQPKPTLYVEVESAGEASRKKRVELKRLISDARTGDLVVTMLVDRWARDVAYTLDVVRKFKRDGIRWIAIEDEIDSDDERGFSDLIRRASEAEIEREKIKRRTVGTRRYLRKAGYFVEGLPPLGYVVLKRKLVIDPAGAEIVKRMFALCIAGKSARETSAILRAEYPNIRGLDASAVHKRLRDRRYLGELSTVGSRGRYHPKGPWIKAHDPIVDQVTFQRAQDAMAKRTLSGRKPSGQGRTSVFLALGLMRCWKCGRVIRSWSPETGASTKHGGYYHCVSKCVRARHDEVDAYLNTETLKHLETMRDRLSKPSGAVVKRIDVEAERRRLLAKRERLVDAISEGFLTREAARGKMGMIERSITALDEQRAPAERVDSAEQLREVDAIRGAWAHATPAERRSVIKTLADRIELESTATKKWERGAWNVLISWRKTD